MSAEESSEVQQHASSGNRLLLVLVWLWVGVPFAYGVYELITTASKLFVQ